jgi:transposase, IS5 family
MEVRMRPKKDETTMSGGLFRARLDQIINIKHELVQFAAKIDWAWIDGEIAPLHSDKGRTGTAKHTTIKGTNRLARRHGVW